VRFRCPSKAVISGAAVSRKGDGGREAAILTPDELA
jgi:hypothetical protein